MCGVSRDHLVGESLQRVGHLEAKRPGGLQTDHKLASACFHLRRKISGVVAAALVAPVRFAATVLHGPSGLASVPSSISTGPIVSTLSTFLISFLVPVTGFTVVAIVGPRTQIQIDSLR